MHQIANASTATWSRADWAGIADRLLAAAHRHASVNGARIEFPGAEGGYGHAIDGLEGFARTGLIAGFRIAGERGEGLDDLIAFMRRGVTAGVDPTAPDRWVRLEEHGQAKVEAASLALMLDMTRPWIWDELDSVTQQRLVQYLSPAVGDDTYPRNNWLWFRIVVQTFLRSVGGPWSADDIATDLALYDSFRRENGWYSDGDQSAYDHYVGWALHLYPVLWARMVGASDLVGDRPEAHRAELDRFLTDALVLVGGDGSPLVQGRSLIYRFAAAAPFWAGVIAGVPSSSPGQLRHAAEATVRHFLDRGALDDDVLTMGWHGPWRPLAQSYSGPGSPYWAAKGLVGIMLPADHPVWGAPDVPLPVEVRDDLRVIESPNWLVSATTGDGIVRVINHGTDHALPNTYVADSPLYARIGYSTATAPLLDELAWTQPLEQSVALVDAAGRVTHRAAIRSLGAEVSGGVGVAASTSRAHWVNTDAEPVRHGAGWAGEVEIVAQLTVCSIVRGPWEVRIWRVGALEASVDAATLFVRVGGWAISGDAVESVAADGSASARCGSLVSAINADSNAVAQLEVRDNASPLGNTSVVPVVRAPLTVGAWQVATLTLTAAEAKRDVDVELDEDVVRIEWPDGHHSCTDLKDFRATNDGDR
ncbi:DUF2264 domain-containing protein [Microbacterium sp. NPDC076911]|uniref:DUF2264 domain-containing protein n=1 Tax=Microbacterium sp. NPDC076911 TaxID=3154958 RepID=UPI00341BD755